MSLPVSGSAAAVCEGFVLAGGQSSRMGRDKSLISFHGERLIRHALDILRNAGLEGRIAGARGDLSTFASILADDREYPGLGPLSGICPALEATAARFAVFLPVDLPLLPASLVSYLVHRAEITGSAITLISVAGFLETFPAVIDRVAAPALRASLASKNRRCLDAFRAAADALSKPFSIVPVEFLLQAGQVCDPRGISPQAWFRSINTPEDLSRAESAAAAVAHP